MRVLRVITPKENAQWDPEVACDVLIDYFYEVDHENKGVKFVDVKGYVANEDGKLTLWELPYNKKLLMIGMILNSPLAHESHYFLHKDEE
jgi:hypothetical protein